MPDPINLRQVRKAKKRADHEAAGAQNRDAFGQTKAAKTFAKATTSLTQRRLDGQRLDRDDKT
jgi:Domain of unknown function (DUF4169)